MARVELVDEELSVEAEVLGVRAQEALGVGRPREHVELLLLERLDVARANCRVGLDVAEGQSTTFACLSECRTDLKHAVMAVCGRIAVSLPRLLDGRDERNGGLARADQILDPLEAVDGARGHRRRETADGAGVLAAALA